MAERNRLAELESEELGRFSIKISGCDRPLCVVIQRKNIATMGTEVGHFLDIGRAQLRASSYASMGDFAEMIEEFRAGSGGNANRLWIETRTSIGNSQISTWKQIFKQRHGGQFDHRSARDVPERDWQWRGKIIAQRRHLAEGNISPGGSGNRGGIAAVRATAGGFGVSGFGASKRTRRRRLEF